MICGSVGLMVENGDIHLGGQNYQFVGGCACERLWEGRGVDKGG